MSTSLSLANLASVDRAVLKSLIQAFWLGAVAVADRMATSPSQFGARSQAQVAIELPIRLKSVWLTKTS